MANFATPVRTKEQRAAGMSITEARSQGATGATGAAGEAQDPFLSTLRDKLMSQADMVSSSSTGVERGIRDAISGIETARDATAANIESKYGREFDYAVANKAFERAGVLDSRTGFATNAAFLRNLDLNTEKSLKDLDQRKQELLLQNDAAAAEKISELQIKEIEFAQQAKQQAFANMLAIGQFDLNVQSEKRAADEFKQTYKLSKMQFDFNKESKMADIATQFGITINPEDDIDSIVTKAANSEYAKLNREKARLEIANLKKSLVDTKNEEQSINFDGLLQDAIAGTGPFEGNPQSPEMAALAVGNYMKSIGINPSRNDISSFTNKARGYKTEYDSTKARVEAEETGKSFWSNFGNFFGASSAVRAQGSISAGFTGQDAYRMATGGSSVSAQSSAGGDQFTSYFNGLFQR